MGNSTTIKTSSNTGSAYCHNQLLFFTYENLINGKFTCLLDPFNRFDIRPCSQSDCVPVKYSGLHQIAVMAAG